MNSGQRIHGACFEVYRGAFSWFPYRDCCHDWAKLFRLFPSPQPAKETDTVGVEYADGEFIAHVLGVLSGILIQGRAHRV